MPFSVLPYRIPLQLNTAILSLLLKLAIPVLFVLMPGLKATAQKIDSIYFNLYTDSLKKGTYNYINVDGRFSDGRYVPLTGKELRFTASAGTFSGNSLFIDSSIAQDKVTIRASLLTNPSTWKEITIYIKKHESNERLRTVEEILNKPAVDSASARKKKKAKKRQ